MVLAYVFIGLFIVVTTVSLFVFLRQKARINELENALSDELVKLTHRQGFYDKSYNLESRGESNKYDFRVYVTELEEYLNGYSKFKFEKVDMINGKDINHYSTIIRYAKEDFVEIQETKNVEFLEVKKDLQQVRKDKLERILKDE